MQPCPHRPSPEEPPPQRLSPRPPDQRAARRGHRHATKRWRELGRSPNRAFCRRSVDAKQRCPRRRQFLLLGCTHLWVMKIQRGKSVNHCRCDDHTRKPFGVRRHHIPRRILRRRLANRLFISLHVLFPETALLGIVRRELPILVRVIKPFQEPFLLFLLRNVEEELAHNRAVAREVTLEAADVLKALIPDVLCDALLGQFLSGEQLGMHAHRRGSPRNSCG